MKKLLILATAVMTLSSASVSAKEYLPYEEYMYTDYYTHENVDLVYDYDYAYSEYLKAHPQEKKEVKKNATKKKSVKKTKKVTKHRRTKKKKSGKKKNVRKSKKTSKKRLTKKH